MRIPVAWLNIIQHKKRTCAALAGISFSIFLIFMQLGFLGATRKNATIVYDYLDFDLLIVSEQFLTLTRAGSVDRYRLLQSEALQEVESVTGVLVGMADWLNEEADKEKNLLIFGVDPDKFFFTNEALKQQGHLLAGRSSILVDSRVMPDFGPWEVGEVRQVNEQPVSVVGGYQMGVGILATGSAFVSYETFSRLNGGDTTTSYNLGLVKLKPGSDVLKTREALLNALPGDVLVKTREEITTSEEHFYIGVKPVGIMFKIGAVVSFIVGAVMLYQILSAEITNRLNEFATMKAIGYNTLYIYKIGIQQGILFSMLGFIPALILSYLLYWSIHSVSGFYLVMTLSRASFVFVLSLLMCAIAGALSLGKIRKADPADLF